MDSKLRTRTTSAARALLLVAFAALLVGCSYSAQMAAHSGPAALGVPVKVGLWDCEDARDVATFVDFDRSLWLPVGADPADLLNLSDVADGPGDTAMMTLIADDLAEYRSDRGPVFTFERHGDTYTFEGCATMAEPLDEG